MFFGTATGEATHRLLGAGEWGLGAGVTMVDRRAGGGTFPADEGKGEFRFSPCEGCPEAPRGDCRD